MISKKQKSELKKALLERQEALIAHTEDHFGLKYEFANESLGELSHYDNHPADTGTELFERGKDVALNEHAEKELEDINAALHAIEEGTYGICTKCGADIPYQRLLAVPTAEECLKHANGKKFDRNRPVEEEVFSPNINPNEKTDEEQVGYDAEDAWQEVSRYGTSETTADFFEDNWDYDEMYPNSDETIGGTDEVENFIGSDIDGKYQGVTPNHKKYEDKLDSLDEERNDRWDLRE